MVRQSVVSIKNFYQTSMMFRHFRKIKILKGTLNNLRVYATHHCMFLKLNALYKFQFEQKQPVKFGHAIKYMESFYSQFMSRGKNQFLFGKGSKKWHILFRMHLRQHFTFYTFHFSHIKFNLTH